MSHRSSCRSIGTAILGRLATVLMIVALLCVPRPTLAVEPSEMLKDTKLELRAREISQKLRCVVCQNQSIDDSNAPLAKDLRVLLRERLTAGDTDRQAISFIVARYGNFVLLRPPLQFNTLLLWIGPLILAGLAFLGFNRYLQQRSKMDAGDAPQAFSADEKARLDALLGTPATLGMPATQGRTAPGDA